MYSALNEIAKHTTGIAAFISCPRKNPVIEGKDLFNSAFFLYQGEVKHITDKTLLPVYDVFDSLPLLLNLTTALRCSS